MAENKYFFFWTFFTFLVQKLNKYCINNSGHQYHKRRNISKGDKKCFYPGANPLIAIWHINISSTIPQFTWQCQFVFILKMFNLKNWVNQLNKAQCYFNRIKNPGSCFCSRNRFYFQYNQFHSHSIFAFAVAAVVVVFHLLMRVEWQQTKKNCDKIIFNRTKQKKNRWTCFDDGLQLTSVLIN